MSYSPGLICIAYKPPESVDAASLSSEKRPETPANGRPPRVTRPYKATWGTNARSTRVSLPAASSVWTILVLTDPPAPSVTANTSILPAATFLILKFPAASMGTFDDTRQLFANATRDTDAVSIPQTRPILIP